MQTAFDYELDLNTNPVIMEKIGYSGDLYLLVKSLYERESGVLRNELLIIML